MTQDRDLTRLLARLVDVVWWLSWAAVIALIALLVLVGTHAASGGTFSLELSFALPAGAYRVTAHALSASFGTLSASSGTVSFARPRAGFTLVVALVLAVSAAAWLYVVGQLRRLLADLRAGDTFARGNARRLRRLGVAAIAFAVGHGLAVWIGGLYLEHNVVARGLRVGAHFGLDVPVVAMGLLLIVLAAAFGLGSELAEEQALTV